MADTFRALCAELVDAWLKGDDIVGAMNRARAELAKADGPAVPEGKKPTRDELWELWLRLNNELPDRPAAVAEFWEHAQIDARARAALADQQQKSPTKHELFKLLLQSGGATRCVSIEWIEPFANAVLARWGRQPTPPADGEVAELVAWLRSIGEGQPCLSDEGYARLTRAAELLERLSPPQPVPVSERPPGPEDCDANGLCWLGSDALDGCTPTWLYGPTAWAERFPKVHRVLLPTHTPPLPEVDE